MKLPPLWKVKRELYRAREQLQNKFTHPFVERLRQSRYDRNVVSLVRETVGALPLSKRIAVFMLFQKNGIAQSTFFTLDHLAQEGWSVLLVSNAPLTAADRARLSERSAHVIERPNIGYDFGAYREGWRWLDRHGIRPEQLILMNDSSWFPLRNDDDSLRRMEALDVDLAGHIFKTEETEDQGHDHLESHLLMLGPRALAHTAVRQFWEDYLMSDSKVLTIQRGEKGLTQMAIASGLSVQGLLGRERLVEVLEPLSDSELLQVLRDLALHNDAGRNQREVWLTAANNGRGWREEFLSWISRELSNSRQHLLSATFVDPAIRFGRMGFLKKSSERRFQLARLALVRAIERGRIDPLEPVVAEEVQAAIDAWKPPFDWRAKPIEVQSVDL